MSPKPITVTFTAAELTSIALVATMRSVQNIYGETKSRYGAPDGEGSWEIGLIGCVGEAAAAKYFRRWWSGAVGDYGAADVGSRLQVRATAHPNGRLRVNPPDKDHQPFVLARVDIYKKPASAILCGWLLGKDCKHERYWSDPQQTGRPAFWVEPKYLNDMTELTADAL
tara:strand:- start:4 stop:510 length:507 start_codon:yes stop_codon:yes gene_type:complete